jgi:hypothetical protein
MVAVCVVSAAGVTGKTSCEKARAKQPAIVTIATQPILRLCSFIAVTS